MTNEQIQALKAAAIAVGRDGRTDDEWFHYLQCVHHKSIRSLLAERDADKALIAEQKEHINSLEEGINMLLAQYDQLAATIGWTTEKALAGEGNQEQYAESMVKRIAELEARTLTVKLPPKVDSSNVPFAAHAWNSCIDEVSKCLVAAGITLDVGE
ncbi:MAG: hypothetical protein KH310_22300 [Enterobacteriaceae bacterium]|nr:hypothetical protein [Enterobacteriaceae bacterium]